MQDLVKHSHISELDEIGYRFSETFTKKDKDLVKHLHISELDGEE